MAITYRFVYVSHLQVTRKISPFDKIKTKTMSTNPQCYLVSLDGNKRIDLPHKSPVTLGRNRDTNIRDLYVSRKQITCFSDLKENKVILKPIGRALSGCNGLALTKDLIYTIGYKDIIEVRLGMHKFEVNFDPDPNRDTEPSSTTTDEPRSLIIDEPNSSTIDEPSSSAANEPMPKKPKLDFPIFSTQKQKTSSMSGATWEEIDNKELLIFTPENCRSKKKIASFDIDGTIIKTKSGARFPKNPDDWMWNIADIYEQLEKLLEDDYKLVFFTNQSGVGNDTTKIKDFKKKIENIVGGLNLPIQVYISLGKKIYRKPRMGMWDVLIKEKNDGVEIDLNKSFYVGDAAGREKNWAPKKNKDHSVADRLFAMNIGIKFYTPEEYFLRQTPVPFKMPDFDPRVDTSHLKYPDLSYGKLNVILMVGGPGSGKSSFVKDVLLSQGYVHVSRDKVGSWQKCVKLMEENLERKRNVVIDNTNVDKETRQRFIQSAKKFNADVRCFIMETSLSQMRHNNKFRELTDKSHGVVSDIIIFSYNKNFQQPEMSEGYAQILKIPFIAKFSDKALEKFYKTFLLD